MQPLTTRVKKAFSNVISQKVAEFCLQIAVRRAFLEVTRMPSAANDSREGPASSNRFKDSKSRRPCKGRQGSNPCYSAKVTVPHGIVTFYFIETAESNV